MQNPPTGQPVRTSIGLESNIAAALSYIWIIGLIFFLMEKENRFVRFHAMQSILFGVANSVIMVALILVNTILTVSLGVGAAVAGGAIGSLVGLLVWLLWLVFSVVCIAFLVGLILTAVKAYQGELFKLPVIGNMAEGIVNK